MVEEILIETVEQRRSDTISILGMHKPAWSNRSIDNLKIKAVGNMSIVVLIAAFVRKHADKML